jgi:hypothetical protein
MKHRHKVAAIVLSATMLIVFEAQRTSAQDTPPDLRMLMNLDLFESRPSNMAGTPAGAAASADSMLDQIRTLDAMGYLGSHPSVNANAGGDDARRAAVGSPVPSSNPPFDVEGPQR